jgi:diguanylate cyclase
MMDGALFMSMFDFPGPGRPSENSENLPDELTASYEVVKKLLPFMANRGIPATPKNYRLFYDYLTYAQPKINKAINKLLAKDVKFDSRMSNSLYNFFYGEAPEAAQVGALNQAADTFISISDRMVESLNTARDQNDHFLEVLTSTSRQMADIDHPDEIKPYLASLMAETEQTLASTDVFSSRLKEAESLIASLKEDLKNQTVLASTDELTKLGNRHRLRLKGPRLIRQALEAGQPVAAIVFDLDWFKKVNDTWGHNQGDQVLKVCAGLIKTAARSTDLAVRLGGEEFLLLCSNLDLATAVKVAERVRESIATTKIGLIDGKGQTMSITVSGGVAAYRPGEDIPALIARADAALYQAKNSGRNRVIASGDSEAPPK